MSSARTIMGNLIATVSPCFHLLDAVESAGLDIRYGLAVDDDLRGFAPPRVAAAPAGILRPAAARSGA